MQEPQAPSPGRDAGPPPESIRPAGLFSDLKYAAAEPAPRPAAPVAVAKRNKVFTHVILPLLIFVVGIAAIAWVTQFMPHSVDTGTPPGQKLRLEFASPNHIWGILIEGKGVSWGPNPPPGVKEKEMLGEYVAEYETASSGQLDKGFCDFEFRNPQSQAVEVGLVDTYCQCSSVQLALLSEDQLAKHKAHRLKEPVPHGTGADEADKFTWKTLTRDPAANVVVEPGQVGIVRVLWNGQGTESPKNMGLWADLGVSPKGAPQERGKQRIQVKVSYVEAVRFLPPTLQAVRFTSGSNLINQQMLECWSATRDLTVSAADDDPFVKVTVETLKPEECRALESRLAKERGLATQVRSACRLHVKVYEQKGDRQFDLGEVHKALPVTFKDGAEVLKNVGAPALKVEVRGDVKVNGKGDRLQVDLGDITPSRRTPEVVKVWTRVTDLEEEAKLDPPVRGLTAKLKAVGAEAGGVLWDLTFSVGDVPGGSLEEGLVVVLRRKNSPQSIRLPVAGHAAANR